MLLRTYRLCDYQICVSEVYRLGSYQYCWIYTERLYKRKKKLSSHIHFVCLVYLHSAHRETKYLSKHTDGYM